MFFDIIETGNCYQLKILIEKGCDINQIDGLLHHAIQVNQFAMIRMICEHGANLYTEQ